MKIVITKCAFMNGIIQHLLSLSVFSLFHISHFNLFNQLFTIIIIVKRDIESWQKKNYHFLLHDIQSFGIRPLCSSDINNHDGESNTRNCAILFIALFLFFLFMTALFSSLSMIGFVHIILTI